MSAPVPTSSEALVDHNRKHSRLSASHQKPKEMKQASTKNKSLKCNHCGKVFSRNTNLRKHIEIHEKIEPSKNGAALPAIPIIKIKKIFNKATLQEHAIYVLVPTSSENSMLDTILYQGVRPFQCDRCSKTFTTKGYLKRHLNIHLKKKQATTSSRPTN